MECNATNTRVIHVVKNEIRNQHSSKQYMVNDEHNINNNVVNMNLKNIHHATTHFAD